MDWMRHSLDAVMQWVAGHGDAIPFMAAGTRVCPKVTKVRVIEAVIIAGIIGAMGYFFMVPRIIDVIETKLGYIQRDIQEMKDEIKDARTDRADLRNRIYDAERRITKSAQ